MRFLAAIFDLDGTLVDNMRVHADVWLAEAARLGLEVTRDRFEREFAGKKNEEIIPALLGRAVAPAEIAALAEAKEARYREVYRPVLAEVAGATALLDALRAAGTRVALATAAPRANRVMVLDGLDWSRRFEAIAGAEDAPRGKPAPDIYLAAAKALGVDPARCVAFEDVPNGIASALAAGMACAALTTNLPAEALLAAGATWTLPDFRELPADLRRRLGY